MNSRAGTTSEPTIVDVAAAAGVSRSTAGRALSGHAAVDPRTREHVLSVAAQMRYRVNPAARSLRGGSSRLIGLIVTNLVNASIQTLVATVHDLAHANGYQVLMAVTNGDPEREHEVMAALADHRIAGLIAMTSATNPRQLHALSEQGVAVVNVIRRPRGIKVTSILNDDHAGARLATDHLVGLGHRQIAFMGGPTTTHSGRERYAGYRAELEAHGIAADSAPVWHGPFLPEWGAETAEELFTHLERCTAVLVANHEAMSGVLNVAAQRSVQIPEDLSLIGFEDAPLFQFWHPAITVIDTDPEALATDAWQALAAALEPDAAPPGQTIVPARLVVRDSCSAPRDAAPPTAEC
jgi:LacI family transcriptional regulator